MADALDDDYLEPASTSSSPAAEHAVGLAVSDDTLLGAVDETTEERAIHVSAKRKRAAEVQADEQHLDEAAKKAKKKQKQKARDKVRKIQRNEARAELTALGGPGQLPCDMQADYLRQVMRKCKFLEKLSEMELDEVAVQQGSLVDTTAFPQERKDDALVDFIRTVSPSTSKTLDDLRAHEIQPAQPVCLVVTGNAMRAADLCRTLRGLLGSRAEPEEGSKAPARNKKKKQKVGKVDETTTTPAEDKEGKLTVAKLFARHFKLKEHIEWLQQNKTPLAAGTPQRLRALMEASVPAAKARSTQTTTPQAGQTEAHDSATPALNLSSLQLLLLDVTWRDEKERGLLEGFETRDETVRLLICEPMRAAVSRGVKIALF